MGDKQTIAKCLGKKIEAIKEKDGRGALTKLLENVKYLAQPMTLKHLSKLSIKPGGKLKRILRPPPVHTKHLFKPLQNIPGKIYMSWPTRCCFLRSSIQSEKFNSKKHN